MKRLFILLLVLVAFFAFSGPSAAWEDRPIHNACNDFLIGKVTDVKNVAGEPGQTGENVIANVSLENGQRITLDFRHSAVGVCRGVQNRADVAVPPERGDSVTIARNISASCEECLATC